MATPVANEPTYPVRISESSWDYLNTLAARSRRSMRAQLDVIIEEWMATNNVEL